MLFIAYNKPIKTAAIDFVPVAPFIGALGVTQGRRVKRQVFGDSSEHASHTQ